MRLETLPGIVHRSPLVRDYLADFDRLAPFYSWDPHVDDSYRGRRDRLRERRGADRGRLAEVLLDHNRRLGCGRATEENIGRLRDPATLAVTTGQQAGILTGPLYTIYKALAAVQLSREWSGRLGCPVVPVFWVASEDHNLAEIDHVDLLDQEGKRTRLQLSVPTGMERCPAGAVPVTPAVFEVIEGLERLTPNSEFKSEIAEFLRETAGRSSSLTEWFGRILTRLFRDWGLVLIDPMDRRLRQLEAGLFDECLERTAEIQSALEAGRRRLEASGYEPTVHIPPESACLFVFLEGQRLALDREGDRFFVRGRGESFSLEELRARARLEPWSFSPNVVLRPVVQEFLLPNLAYVGGPGEISYFGLYRDVFGLFGFEMPIIYPRPNLTLVEPPIARYLEKWGLKLPNVFEGLDDKLREVMEAEDRVGLSALFNDFRSDFELRYGRLLQSITVLDRNLTNVAQETLRQIRAQFNRLEDKTRQEHRKNCEVAVRQFSRIRESLCPGGVWQERLYNVFPFLLKYGPGLIRGLQSFPLTEGVEHKVVFLGD